MHKKTLMVEQTSFIITPPFTSKIQMFKHTNKSHNMNLIFKKIHPSQIFHHYKLHFSCQLLKKMEEFLTSLLKKMEINKN
jgi:hypothetical protein